MALFFMIPVIILSLQRKMDINHLFNNLIILIYV